MTTWQMSSNYLENNLKKNTKSLKANNIFLQYKNRSDVNQGGFTNISAIWKPYATTSTREFLITTFLAKLLVPPTIGKRLMAGKYLLWKHWQGVVTAWHLLFPRPGLIYSIGCTDAFGNTGQHNVCVSTQVMNSHLYYKLFSFVLLCLVGYCSQRQILAQTTAGNVWWICSHLSGKLREASQPAVQTELPVILWTPTISLQSHGETPIRATTHFSMSKWCIAHVFQPSSTKTLCHSYNCPQAHHLTSACQPVNSTRTVTKGNCSHEVLDVCSVLATARRKFPD